MSDQMCDVASVTFAFDGTEREFARIFEAICDLDVDIGAFSLGTTGVVEFMIGDFSVFREQVARRSAELGLELVVQNHLKSEQMA